MANVIGKHDAIHKTGFHKPNVLCCRQRRTPRTDPRQQLTCVENFTPLYMWMWFIGRPFVKPFALCYRSVVCLSVCLSVTLVYCGQTVGRIKMKLDTQVGLGPGHIVLNGDPGPPSPKGHTPNFQPMSVVAKWLVGLTCHLVWR